MKDLKFLLRRMSQTELANMMSINKTNITNWLAFDRVPKKRIIQLKEIKNGKESIKPPETANDLNNRYNNLGFTVIGSGK